MYISKPLDYFKTKFYNMDEVSLVEKFMNYDFDVKKIFLVWRSKGLGTGSAIHQNRQNLVNIVVIRYAHNKFHSSMGCIGVVNNGIV